MVDLYYLDEDSNCDFKHSSFEEIYLNSQRTSKLGFWIIIGLLSLELIKRAFSIYDEASLVAQMVQHLPAMWAGIDLCSIPGSERSPGEGNGNPLQYSCLENSMDGGPW